MARIDDAAQFAAGWDWITPLETVIRDLLHGPIHRFAVPFGAGWSGKQVGRLLKSHGVPSWGWMVRGDTIFFRVRLKQARWAQYVMLREGIPLEEGIMPGEQQWQPQPARPQARSAKRWLFG